MKLPEIGTRYHICTGQPAQIVEASQFGRAIEPDFMVEGALAEDGNAMKKYDVLSISARPASQTRAKQIGMGA